MSNGSSFDEQQRRLEAEFEKQFEQLKENKPNILVVGRTGAGKSSLINAIFAENVAEVGQGRPVTQHYQVFTQHPFVTLYDSKGWEGGGENDRQFKDDTRDFIKQHLTTDPHQHIHVVWYVIAANTARFEEYDAQLIREAFGGLQVLVILTKCDTARESEAAAIEKALREANVRNVIDVVRVAADPLPALRQPPWGIDLVVTRTLEVLPELFKEAFNAAQVVNLDQKAEMARKIVVTAAVSAAAVGFFPVPFSDAMLLGPIQLTMLGSIGAVYGFGKDPHSLATMALGSVGPMLAEAIGVSLASNILKFIPVAGTIAAGLIEGPVATSITAALGYSFLQLCHHVATLRAHGQQPPLNADWMKGYLQQVLPQVSARIRQGGIQNYLPEA